MLGSNMSNAIELYLLYDLPGLKKLEKETLNSEWYRDNNEFFILALNEIRKAIMWNEDQYDPEEQECVQEEWLADEEGRFLDSFCEEYND